MISFQHACLPSVLAYAAATALPPSPSSSPPRCYTPTITPSPPPTTTTSTTTKKTAHPAATDAAENDTPDPPSEHATPQSARREDDGSAARDVAPEPKAPVDPLVAGVSARLEPLGLEPKTKEQEQKQPESAPEAVKDEKKAECASKMAPEPMISVSQFAHQFYLQRYQESQRRASLLRISDLHVSVHYSARLLRVAAVSHKGLVDSLRHGDKSAFASVYNAVHEIREVCESAVRRSILDHDPLVGTGSVKGRPHTFLQRLSARSRAELLEILTLVRTDSQFLFECINNLTSSQLSALVNPVHSLEISSPPDSRGRSQPSSSSSSFYKRGATHSPAFKDYAFSFERTDPLFALLFNVYSTTLDPDSSEVQLRLDVWSSTCAKLISHGGSGMYTFVGHLLNIWSGLGEWKAKAKFEMYLMDILQNGAFLLESNSRHSDMDGDAFDPMKTDVAEQFFRTSVQALFEVLDDSDGGFPAGSLEFGRAIIEKLGVSDTCRRFLGYIFYQWFFGKFVHSAMCFPESHGLLLDFHVTKDARERLLGHIALYAQRQVSHILQSLPSFSYIIPKIKTHVDRMLSRLVDPVKHTPDTTPLSSPPDSNLAQSSMEQNNAGSVILLSSSDILTILDVFFPKPLISGSPDLFSQQTSFPSSPASTFFPRSGQPHQSYEPGLFQGRLDTHSYNPPTAKTMFTTEISFQDVTKSYFVRPSKPLTPESPKNPQLRKADRIRDEILEIRESEDRPTLDHPANEDWTMLSVSGRKPVGLYATDTEQSSHQSPASRTELLRNQDKIEAAVVKIVHEFDFPQNQGLGQSSASPTANGELSLKKWFLHAMGMCQRKSDFSGAHFWWEASLALRDAYAELGQSVADTKYLSPMYRSVTQSADLDSNMVQRCEQSFIDLKRKMDLLQSQVNKAMGIMAQLRNKMWYMTDVKNSLRYEDAKNVALALKNMALAQATQPAAESRSRAGARTLGGSFLQKPEIQVMNVMRAARSQGGPFKLADEQVEITRKWLQRFGIVNFCRGEERIHRFCYEVKTSVNKLAGETMYDTPVLWSSELFQRERSTYDTPGTRPMSGSVRPSSIASEDSLGNPMQPPAIRSLDQLFRPPNDLSMPPLVRKSSFQSVTSDKWQTNGNASSISDSPGKTVSTATTDSIYPYWSPMQTQTQSITSASSLRSRPPSMFSDNMPYRRTEHNSHGKHTFLDGLKRNLTSLLLSDLGCPVWSCGSETDAWFSAYLNQPRVQSQMEKRTRLDRFLSQCSTSLMEEICERDVAGGRLRRSRSTPSLGCKGNSNQKSKEKSIIRGEVDGGYSFGYEEAFEQLMDKFSRPANPYVKLEALHEMWTLVATSLSSSRDTPSLSEARLRHSMDGIYRRNSLQTRQQRRKSSDNQTPTPSSPGLSPAEAPSGLSIDAAMNEAQITNTLRDLIQKYQPRTLFRDLQFISSFVPSDILNKTESGTAFLQFSLAALKLKDDVCNSMIEIADKIVCDELAQRHRHSHPISYDFSPKVGNGIKDAANMWIVTAREGNPVAQRELAILYLTHPHLLRPVTLPLTKPGDTFKAEVMYRRDQDSKSDPQNMCLALHWMQLSAAGGDELAKNWLKERQEFESIS
ncbi:Chromatin assembly factor 1 subunit rlf2 [Trichophyton interdigitale]|nr:Chromatin assembly factor 1 subunit rlf2 [Trichophyton interdigitale]KAG8208644.1 Chromatin assembly factor 1 subunit rlf2 [Trichophyton interdigitale]